MAHAGEDHSEAEAVGSSDDIVVAYGAAGLNDRGSTGFRGFFDAVREREEGVGGDDAASQRRLRFHYGDFYGVDATHLAGADSEGGTVASEDDGVGFYVFLTFQAKRMACISSCVGTRLVTVRRSASLISPRLGCCTSMPPRMRLSWSSRSGSRPPGGSSSRRRFFLAAKMDFALSSKAGAAMHSTKSLATSSAVAASTSRLKARTPPKAEIGSLASAFRYASGRVSCSAAPQGLLCLMMTAAGRRNSAARLRPASRSTKLL